MTFYIFYDILKPSVFWKIWRKGASNFISWGGLGGSDGLDPSLLIWFKNVLYDACYDAPVYIIWNWI